MVTMFPWLLMVMFAGSNTMVSMQRFETESLCRSAASAAVKFYSEATALGYEPKAWKCQDISQN